MGKGASLGKEAVLTDPGRAGEVAAGVGRVRRATFSASCKGRMWLCDEMGGEEHVLESVSAKDDLAAPGELVDGVEDLIPGVLRHETDERIQTDDGLLIEMVENGCHESIGIWTLPLYRMNIWR
jgi:hypothetical protein